jgi:hypothetical protein
LSWWCGKEAWWGLYTGGLQWGGHGNIVGGRHVVVTVGMVRQEEPLVSGISDVGGGCSADGKATLLLNVLERGGTCEGATVKVFALGLVLDPGSFGERDNSFRASMIRDEVVHNSSIGKL